jgi:hypothetical protein
VTVVCRIWVLYSVLLDPRRIPMVGTLMFGKPITVTCGFEFSTAIYFQPVLHNHPRSHPRCAAHRFVDGARAHAVDIYGHVTTVWRAFQ